MALEFEDTEQILMEHEPLFRLTSQEAADRWLREAWALASDREKVRIIKSVFLWPTDVLQIPQNTLDLDINTKQLGGAQTDRHDIRITRLLAVADSFHDFDDASKPIAEWLVPKWLQLPNEITVENLRNTNVFIELATSTRTFTFGNETVANPLYGETITKVGMNLAAEAGGFEQLYEKQSRSVRSLLAVRVSESIPVDIWHTAQDGRKVIQLEQVAQVIGAMRKLYGKTATVVLDGTNEPLAMLVVSLKYVARSLLRFMLDDVVHQNVEGLTKRMKELLAVEKLDDGSWDIHLIDANVFDAMDSKVGFTLDPLATGQVYRHEMAGYEVRLDGIKQTKHGRHVQAMVKDTNGASFKLAITNREATRHFSLDSIRTLARQAWKLQKAGGTGDDVEDMLDRLTPDTLLALKRAGDWGQVEACARRNMVFITKDRFAALYARYRGVRCIYVSGTDYTKNGGLRDMPLLFQTTFVMAWVNR